MLLEWKSCGCLDNALNAKFAFIEKQVILTEIYFIQLLGHSIAHR